jgi:alpha-glucosidase
MLLNLGLSGISYSGTDIGGFSGNPDAELYTRWFQMAAFNPLFRNHAARGTEAREPWVYGEPYTSIIREFIELRLAMQPYWYTLAEESTRTGAPLMRPLFWHHPEKREFHDYDEAFLLGEHLLVAPVVEPGQTNKDIVLPPGDWYDYWSNALLSRSGRVNVRISLEKIPLFVRAGTVLPIDKGSTLELSIYLDKKGSAKGRVYFDSGDGYNPGAEIEIFAHEKDGSVDVQLSKNRAYPLPWKSINPVVVGKSSDVTISLDY